jgi:hypothetical protein
MMTGLTGAFLAVVIGAAAVMSTPSGATANHAAAAGAAPVMVATAQPLTVSTPAPLAAPDPVAAPVAAASVDPTDEAPGTATGTRKIKKSRRSGGARQVPSTTPAATTRPAAPAEAVDSKDARETLAKALAERPL